MRTPVSALAATAAHPCARWENERTHFLGVQILVAAGDVLRQRKRVEPFGDCRLDHLLQRALRMGAELPRVAVVGEGHGQKC